MAKKENGSIDKMTRQESGNNKFSFYRGAALTMASDLSGTPVSGMKVQGRIDEYSNGRNRIQILRKIRIIRKKEVRDFYLRLEFIVNYRNTERVSNDKMTNHPKFKS
jgi:hypothetical protein